MKLANGLAAHLGDQWIWVAALFYFRYIIVGVLFALHSRATVAPLAGKTALAPGALIAFVLIFRFLTLHNLGALLRDLLEPVACGLFTMWFPQNPSRCAVLRWRAVQWLGACSYGIYLWQQLFTAPEWSHGWHLARFPEAWAAILICAAVSYYIVERPGIRLGRKLTRLIAR